MLDYFKSGSCIYIKQRQEVAKREPASTNSSSLLLTQSFQTITARWAGPVGGGVARQQSFSREASELSEASKSSNTRRYVTVFGSGTEFTPEQVTCVRGAATDGLFLFLSLSSSPARSLPRSQAHSGAAIATMGSKVLLLFVLVQLRTGECVCLLSQECGREPDERTRRGFASSAP